MASNFPPVGTPQRRRRMDYMNGYVRNNYLRRSLMFSKQNPVDMRIVEGLAKLPNGKRNEFIKKAIAEKLGIE